MTQTTASRAKAIDKIYANAKVTAVDSLGGPRAYNIAGPSIRRMAIAAAILGVITIQDESIAAETVRNMADELNTRLVDDGAGDWL